MQIDKRSGKVAIFCNFQKKVVRVAPVDAREILDRGLGREATAEERAKLGIVLATPAKRKGRVANPPKAEDPKDPEGDGDDEGGDNDEPYDFTKHKVEELRTFALEAGIADSTDMKRGKLIEALDKIGFRPVESE